MSSFRRSRATALQIRDLRKHRKALAKDTDARIAALAAQTQGVPR